MVLSKEGSLQQYMPTSRNKKNPTDKLYNLIPKGATQRKKQNPKLVEG